MKFTKPAVLSVSVIAASTLVVGGVALANTQKADSAPPAPSSSSLQKPGDGLGRHGDRKREALTGEAKAKSEDAAKAKVAGGTVSGSFKTPFGSVVEMTAADGSKVRVMLNASNEVMSLRQVWKEMPRPEGGKGMHGKHGGHGKRGGPGPDGRGGPGNHGGAGESGGSSTGSPSGSPAS